MHIRKAVITAAGRGVRLYPAAEPVQKGMLPIVDRDGVAKPVLQIIAEEAIESGIEELCVVCAPGDEEKYRNQFQSLRENLLAAYKGADWAQRQAERVTDLLRRLHFAEQAEPLGYGHAVYCAKDFVGPEPFLLLLGDHLYISHVKGQRCAQQLLNLARQEGCAVAAVQATREHLVGHYGTLSAKRVPNAAGLYQIEKIIEKPSVSVAEIELQTPGLRVGHYLCFFGVYVLTPSLFRFLEDGMGGAERGRELQLTPALQELAERERCLALEVAGRRYDIGQKFGWLKAQIALALAGEDREQVLTSMLEVMAEAGRSDGQR